MTVSRSWPICGADNYDSRGRSGDICQGIGAGYRGRCRWHGGLDLPSGDWHIMYAITGIYLWDRLDPDYSKQQISWDMAARFIITGRVKRGVFWKDIGQGLLNRVQYRRVKVWRSPQRSLLSEYRFGGR